MTDSDTASTHPELCNPVWASLTGPHRPFARIGPDGRAAAFQEGFGFFVGFDDPNDPGAWDDATDLLDDDVGVFFFPDPVSPPGGWELVTHIRASQLGALGDLDDLGGEEPAGIVELGRDDHDDIVALAKLAEPGPFDIRTPELGRFVGRRDDGRLVAMAGERLRSDTTVEISAVSVHPDDRRRGLGAQVTAAIATAARDRGQLPYLHVLDGNDAAEQLYAAMGFELIREMVVTVFERSS